MTASLLARKGAAAPSFVAPAKAPALWEHPVRGSGKAMPEAPLSQVLSASAQMFMAIEPVTAEPVLDTRAKTATIPEPDKPRRIMVLVTNNEIERLAIAAIKKGKTRHEIVREALDSYLARLAREFPSPCSCVLNGAKPV
jgi:hypothetical protein